MSICSGIALPVLVRLYRSVQYTAHVQRRRPPRDAPADARDPRVRGAGRRALPRRRGPGLRAPVDRAGGRGRRRVLAARPDRRDHVDPPRPRPLPRQGPRPARDVRRADGARTRARTAGAAARCTSPIPTLGIFGANGIVAAGLPIAVGAATAAQLRADGTVAVAFFGDGAVAHGTFHEAVNLAAVWQLPVVFFCENNGYAEFSPAATQHAAPLERRAAGYGVDYVAVDGNDVVATATAMQRRRRRACAPGAVRSIVEATTYRWHGHYEGDPQRYRSPDEVQRVGGARPAARARARGCASAGVADDALGALRGGGRARARRRASRPRGSWPRPPPRR